MLGSQCQSNEGLKLWGPSSELKDSVNIWYLIFNYPRLELPSGQTVFPSNHALTEGLPKLQSCRYRTFPQSGEGDITRATNWGLVRI